MRKVELFASEGFPSLKVLTIPPSDKPPEVVVWDGRAFVLADEDPRGDGVACYTERTSYVAPA